MGCCTRLMTGLDVEFKLIHQNWGYYKDFEISSTLADKAEESERFRNVNICMFCSLNCFLKNVGLVS